MKIPARPALLALTASLLFGLETTAAGAAPAGLPERHVDLELREADLKNVFALLAEVSERPVELDPCVHGAVDIQLSNVPVALVFDALAQQVGLHYEDDAGKVVVRCGPRPSTPAAILERRVSVAESGAALPDILARIVASGGLAGVDYRASARPQLTFTLERVKLGTALAALGDASGLRIRVEGDRLVASE